MELAPGTVLLSKYRIDEVLGTGGMGKVLRASHLYLQQSVAIKVLLPHMADSASTVSRFLREAQATVNLKSEHIARVIDVGTMPGSGDSAPIPFMVMEYLEGNDLNQILRHHGPQTPAVVCDLMLQACEGMAEAHAMGIVHRDIKPSNFFITRRADGTMLLKILDFGISKTPVGVTELTGTQTILGTPTYMAPEQMKTSKGAEPRSDIWSIGVVMYQLITGRPPFSGESYAELVLKVNNEAPAPFMVPLPPGLGQVILRCIEKSPNMRPQNVGELARQLAPYASDPVAAAASSARTTRILQHRTSQKGVDALPLTASGGRATPMPIQPAQLTPRSWPSPMSMSGSSLSHSRGQVTHRVRASRGFLVAGITCLTILAATGGFFASRWLSGSDDDVTPAASAPPAPPATEIGVTTPPPATPDLKAKDPAPVATDKPTDPTPALATDKTTDPTPTLATDKAKDPTPATDKAPKPDTRPADVTAAAKAAAELAKSFAPTPKPEVKPAAKPVATKPTVKSTATKAVTKPKPPPKKKPRPKGDLFDTRK